ncbi:bifunctional methylenetetrahydrofolate dehydrogenase/methenyltetrahydrofolate cyclohydrolase FolD [Parvularcula sp. LCG005]|uniref:bifunctional methylenetetrahydrofolate dehydrogenase/methenyltetrahydrofolate cyclohydrolase FolD n=1 Tax=Parvularcula sp. LCG005 TaxID=3078805 RepID=UPI0029428283|nr:bifunctional methylenetetrahydrofolate dehydrogenase/methenyltetrahydrofolate cyclohydrolase FolD [Parvularcula sp. LCG005]WOI53092.1 bifunctional methylenetetrahydrofolate dehydrogenase/methenyltetrahydrofolate cyclohydrolase FolD [Parvularcula sp. LCG005]
MTATLIDGKAIAAQLRVRVAEAASALKTPLARAPGLAVILVGEDPASQVYVRNKAKQTREAGMESFEFKLPAESAQEAVERLIQDLNADDRVDGILLQLPLPSHLNSDAAIALIDPEKDVDGLTEVNAGRVLLGRKGLVACTPQGSVILAKSHLGDLSGKHAVVIGRSILVGKPLSMLLQAENCTVTMAHSRTKDLPDICRQADILCAAVGRPEMIHGDWIKPGATVIDVGINRVDGEGGKSRLVGDVAFDEAVEVAGAITPVPGGVGPMTIACLLRNTVLAAARRHGLDDPSV